MPIEITTASEEVKEGIRTALEAAKEDRLTPADWEEGTSTTPGTPAPVDIAAAIAALAPSGGSSVTTPTIVIDDNVIEFFGYPTTIADNQFTSTGATAVQIGNSVTSIGSYAFRYNSLTFVTIPDSVTSIGGSAFSNNSLTFVTIPDSVTSIGANAFSSNSLTSITIPDSVTSIGANAFSENLLTSVTIGNAVTSIGSYAFYSNSLTFVTIPDNVTSIGGYAFFFNPTLSTVNCYVTKTIIDAATSIFSGTAEPLTIHARSSDATWAAGTGLSIGGNPNVTVIKDL